MKLRLIFVSLLTILIFQNVLANAADIEWEPSIYPENQLFPSMLISTATIQLPEEAFSTWDGNHLGDTQGCIGVTAENVPKGAKVELVVKANGYLDASTFTGKVEDGEGTLTVHPKIRYFYDALGKVKQAVPLDITMELKVDGVSLGEKTQTVILRPVNDCLFSVEETAEEDDETTNSDYTWLFAAYVNEDHPWVDKILKSALDLEVVDSFSGMQSEDTDEELKQIFAIWCVLRNRGLKYSDITTNSRESETVFSQTVRFLDESIRSTQANCVDGSVLLASILRKIGLKPSLILVPGHMYLSIELDNDMTIGLETTMLGNKDDSEADFSNFPESELEAPEGFEDSWDNFKSAVSAATGDLQENQENFKDFDAEDFDPNYQIIDIAAARALGILPIARTGK